MRGRLAAVAAGVALVGHIVFAAPTARADGAAWFRLAVATERGVYVANGDGSGLRRIATMEDAVVPSAYLNAVTWAPEGAALAYSGYGCDEPPCPAPLGQVRVMRPDGSRNRAVVELPMYVSQVTWSPDGSHLAYVAWTQQPPCFCPGSVPTVHITSRSGITRVPLGHGVDPAWSPSGHQLAFSGIDQRIRVVDLAAPTRSRVASPPQVLASQPTWGPDGRRLAFVGSPVRERPFGPTTVWTMRSDGTDLRELPLVSDSAVAWSPDGRRLALYTNGAVAVANTDGSGRRPLHARGYGGLAWVPDGSGVSTLTDGSGGDTAVSIVAADGSGQRTIIRGVGVAVALAWSD